MSTSDATKLEAWIAGAWAARRGSKRDELFNRNWAYVGSGTFDGEESLSNHSGPVAEEDLASVRSQVEAFVDAELADRSVSDDAETRLAAASEFATMLRAFLKENGISVRSA